jgi:hypothetical protein
MRTSEANGLGRDINTHDMSRSAGQQMIRPLTSSTSGIENELVGGKLAGEMEFRQIFDQKVLQPGICGNQPLPIVGEHLFIHGYDLSITDS